MKGVINRHYEVHPNHDIRRIEQCRFNMILLKNKGKKNKQTKRVCLNSDKSVPILSIGTRFTFRGAIWIW